MLGSTTGSSETVTLNTTDAPCFLAGTRILTDIGEIAVEALTLDNLVVTRDGGRLPMRWIDRSRMDTSAQARPDEACPVRIKAGAFSESIPHRDLLVTPEHCILVDGHLIPARMLVDDRSIVIEASITQYEYYPIECERHCVLVSEGLTTESYCDSGHRSRFGVAVGVAGATLGPLAAPLGVERSIAEPAWRRLDTRARQTGFAAQADLATARLPLTHDSELRLTTDAGHTIKPISTTRNRHTFAVPAGSTGLRLLSRTARPSDMLGPFVDDRRALGVLVVEVAVWDRRDRIVVNPHLNTARLAGWFDLEGGRHRWTAGDAAPPLTLTAEPSMLANAGPYLAASAACADHGMVSRAA